MAKNVDLAHAYTVDEIAAVLRRIDAARAVFVDFLDECEKQPGKTLAAHNSRTLERALVNLDSVAAAVSKSIYAARSGNPLQVGALKPRSVAHAAKTTRVAETPRKYPKTASKRRKSGNAR